MDNFSILEGMNKAIDLLNYFINFLVSLVPIPAVLRPPQDEQVRFMHRHLFWVDCTYRGDKYVGSYLSATKRATYDKSDVLFYRFVNVLNIPHIPTRKATVTPTNITLILGRKEKEVWDYKDPLGKEYKVTYNQRKQLEKNPLATTVGDKAEKLKANQEKAMELKHNQLKQIRGNSL